MKSSTLKQAISQSDFGAVRSLLDSMTHTDDELMCALHDAIRSGQAPVVRLLLQAGANPNNPLLTSGWRPLHVAIEHQQHDIVTVLLEWSVDVNIASNDGMTPLHLAIDIEADSAQQQGIAPVPCSSGLLLEHGADPLVRDSSGMTPLDWARQYGYSAVIDLINEASGKTGE